MQGYRKALNAHGLDVDGRQVRLMECSSTEKGGRQIFRKVLKSGWRPSAVVAMSDIIAIGVMREALEAGLRVPADLSIAGFDNIPLSAWVNPPLTTVAQPLQKKGRLAAEILLQAIEGQSDPRHHVLPTKLVARKSVAAPSAS
jgi:DNA-binding LacI/PurR family transcriptional regulator